MYKEALLKREIGELRKRAAAFEPPIELTSNDTKGRIVKKIIAREETEAKRDSPSVPAGPGSASGPPRPGFEAAASAPAALEPEFVERRGGARPGSGRPLGMTDEKAAVKNLPKQPNMAIRQGVYLAGQAWSKSVEIPAVAFTDEETDLLALPITQIQERYWPGLIPEMGAVFVSLLYGIHQVIVTRLTLIKAVQAKRQAGIDVETIIGNKPKEETKVKNELQDK